MKKAQNISRNKYYFFYILNQYRNINPAIKVDNRSALFYNKELFAKINNSYCITKWRSSAPDIQEFPLLAASS